MTFPFSTILTTFTIRGSSARISRRWRIGFRFISSICATATRCAHFSPRKIRRHRASGRARGRATFDPSSATLLRHECDGNVASARSRAHHRHRAFHLRFEFVGLRRFEKGAVLRRDAYHADNQSVRGEQSCGRISLLDLLASLSDADCRVAIFYCLWSAATARSGHPPIHEKNSRGRTDRSIRGWHDAPRLHLHRRHHSGRGRRRSITTDRSSTFSILAKAKRCN